MDLEDKVCYCFHVSRRKLVNWARLHEPKVASQLSMCGGAGTGCGWCIPFLKQIFKQHVEQSEGIAAEIDRLTPEEYAIQRAEYVKSGQGKPPPGAEPLPGPESTEFET